MKAKLSDVLDIFVKAGYEVTVYPTQAYRDALRVVQEYQEDTYDLLVCGGGDGTINEVVTGMTDRAQHNVIGYIPTGTVNDYATSLHIPTGILEAADNAVHGVPFSCDVGKFNGKAFAYIAAFGIFTDVSYETNQDMKNLMGNLAYVLNGVTRLFDIPSYKVKVSYDDTMIEGDFIYGMVSNSRSVGGFRNMLGSEVKFDDGLFEVTLIETPKDLAALQEIITALMIEDAESKYIIRFQTDRVYFEFQEDVSWTLDGEYGGVHTAAVVENLNREMDVMVPQSFIDAQKEDQVEDPEDPERLS